MINIIHIVEDYSFLSGGLRTVVNDLHTKLIKNGLNSTIITTRKEKNDNAVKVKGGNFPWRFSSNLKEILKEMNLKKDINIIHIHGVWMYPQYFSAKFAINNNIPFLISCHGMYEPWLWSNSSFKKKAYFKYVVKDVFSKANFLHAITEPEADELKKLFPKTAVKVIPNLIDSLPKIDDTKLNFKNKYILFLGRIDKKKGIDLLIKSFANIKNKNFNLKIAGAFNNYKEELEELVKTLNLEDRVNFLGLVTGEEKQLLFKNSFVFVAPSYSEVIGMVNLEAAIMGVPTITTIQTGIKKEWANNGGFLINPNLKEIQTTLEIVTNWSDKERNEKGEMLKNYVEKEYSWKYRFLDWLNFYKKIV